MTATAPTQLGYPPTMANLLPQVPNFSGGEQRDGETVQDWIEHFESVALLAGWNDHFKLVHLVSLLRGTAHAFYRSCTPALKRRLPPAGGGAPETVHPVQLTAIRTQLFHGRKQETRESVDDFAQDLRKLHSRTYSTATYANPEAEKVGQMVLANQFISGLRPELQAKVVGMDGSLDALVLKARFEEAKAKELATMRSFPSKKSIPATSTETTPTSQSMCEPSTSTPSSTPTDHGPATLTREEESESKPT